MPAVVTPAKRALGGALAALRQRAGIYAVDVARTLGYTSATISRYETGHAVPSPEDLATMLNLYGADTDDRAQVEAAVAKARLGTKRIRSTGVAPQMRSYLRAEADADSIQTVNPVAVPGLLQTEDYATAVHVIANALSDPTISIAEAVASRMKRQRRLIVGPAPLRLHAIVDEAVIRRTAELGEIGRAQLAHLVSLSERENILVQVVPFVVGLYGTMTGPMTRFGYPGEGDDTAVYLEYPGGGAWVRGDEVRRFDLLFGTVERVALSPAHSASLINRVGQP